MIATKKTGFSLVELTIVVVILGILATFAVPRFMSSVEKTKASEAFSYSAQIEGAQARYSAEHGKYSNKISNLDIDIDTPDYFSVSGISSSNWETKWEMTLTRNAGSSGYGRYKVVFNQNGFDSRKSTIKKELAPAL
ncbi:MAG: prepilin-type N-terminal cleavage/methylation domain-containing protein [Planctomycetes bacterium]|nr:prepilin-type N-terminal cleavage/methylation domain-containing protein [Planctomycetota bacterium]MCP4769807.1 prepilin-type N-terminal cleavage/methylation domain-containing protein [Planctomycetota bacterium]MCP4859647.1 prepilin-type N-terminal cleavage/methylation domain-containing protein [Planctomycetota bacterium]